jgi:hypothetical protein
MSFGMLSHTSAMQGCQSPNRAVEGLSSSALVPRQHLCVQMSWQDSLLRTCQQLAGATGTPMVASAGTAAGCVALPPCCAVCAAAVPDCGRAWGCGSCAGARCGPCQLGLESEADRCFGCAHAGRRLWCCCDAWHAAAPLLLAIHVCHAAGPAVGHHGWWLQCEVRPRARLWPALSRKYYDNEAVMCMMQHVECHGSGVSLERLAPCCACMVLCVL